jgi:hypothetical protein
VSNPVAIDTDIQLAPMRQIHCAIEHIRRGDFECAITLGAAGEGMLPNAEQALFRDKVKKLSVSEEIKAAAAQPGPTMSSTG